MRRVVCRCCWAPLDGGENCEADEIRKAHMGYCDDCVDKVESELAAAQEASKTARAMEAFAWAAGKECVDAMQARAERAEAKLAQMEKK